MMPLWTTAMALSSVRCGWALHSVTPPCVAQRVCPIASAQSSLKSRPLIPLIFPVAFFRERLPSCSFHATPQESYPRYSRLLSPSTAIIAASRRLPEYPKIPHMGDIVRMSSLRGREKRRIHGHNPLAFPSALPYLLWAFPCLSPSQPPSAPARVLSATGGCSPIRRS